MFTGIIDGVVNKKYSKKVRFYNFSDNSIFKLVEIVNEVQLKSRNDSGLCMYVYLKDFSYMSKDSFSIIYLAINNTRNKYLKEILRKIRKC